MEVSQNAKSRITILPTSGYIPEKNKNTNSKRYMSSMFIAALFTTVKVWRQPKCPLTDEWIKKIRYLFAMQYYSAIKKRTKLANCSNMNGLVGHYAK